MRFDTGTQITELIKHEVVEAASLEFKRELNLGTKSERTEALKDLTGMANGGGGTILYGIEESDSDDWPSATAIRPLTEIALQAKLENIVRDGIQPPLLVQYNPIRIDGGFVLAVDVSPSPLGPYMVEAREDRRYYRRTGTSVTRMTEREVRDAYALAARSRERRTEIWTEHNLPLTPATDDLWVVVSAVPEEPLTEVLDLSTMSASDFMPPDSMMTYINNWEIGDLTPTIRSLRRWVDGFHGHDADDSDPFSHELRLHRSGAGGVATKTAFRDDDGPVWTPRVFRILNTSLLYLGWLSETVGLTTAVEIRIDLHGAGNFHFRGARQNDFEKNGLEIATPFGVAIDSIHASEHAQHWKLSRAADRHSIVMRFADRLHQAFGEPQAEAPFRRGVLYDAEGRSTRYSVYRNCIWDNDEQAGHQAEVHSDGSIVNKQAETIGWHLDGVVVDLRGDAMAVLELAPGVACPEGFVAANIERDPEGSGLKTESDPRPNPRPSDAPEPTGAWADIGLESLL